MKNPLTIFLALIIAIAFASCNSKPSAKQVIGKSYKKCQLIKSGHYEMSRKMKYMSDKDTLISHYTCDFKKMPDDTIYGVYFSSCDEYPGNEYFSKVNYLYTGDEFVQYDDTAGTVISCALWSDIINRGKHNRTFYTPLVRKDSYPLTFHKYRHWSGEMQVIKKWGKKVIMDAATGKFYTIFIDDGITTLKKINIENGTAETVAVFGGFPFIENLRIYNGKAYFLYANDVSRNKRLYEVVIE